MALLDGKVAVITGAGTGLGRSYARLLAQQGAAVVVNDFAPAPANNGGEEIRGRGGRAVGAIADVGCMASSGGILRDKSLLKMEEEDWDAVVRVHLKGTFCVTKPIFGHMKERGTGGVIVNTTSTAGMRGKFGQTNYGSAKAGIWGFSNSLAQEGLKYGIRVWTIAPAAASQLTDGVVSDDDTKIVTAARVPPGLRCMD